VCRWGFCGWSFLPSNDEVLAVEDLSSDARRAAPEPAGAGLKAPAQATKAASLPAQAHTFCQPSLYVTRSTSCTWPPKFQSSACAHADFSCRV